ncbi:hypothetical protein L195_g050591 [Trifolium pratense]|uniref:Uncharacterized protein n=1 Tax=Trifolium pratense TaxID=57577 RepID=A0A2K3JUY0_TRIPR|nr:hypothetical protein L195_g050591 [Trifolium pratense]
MVVLRWLWWRSKNGGDCGGGGGGEETVVVFLVMNLNLWIVDEVEELKKKKLRASSSLLGKEDEVVDLVKGDKNVINHPFL